MRKNYRAERKRLGIPKGMRRNKDGSYEGFVSAQDANRLIKQMFEDGHKAAVKVAKKKFDMAMRIAKSRSEEN